MDPETVEDFKYVSSVNSNISNVEEYTPYPERPATYIVPIVFAVMFLVGVLGNGTLVLIFIRHRTMRNVPNTYILSLALGDLLVIISCVPFTSTLYTIESWPYGGFVCKLCEATKEISIGVSVFTLTVLSAERYCAIVNPIRRHISTKPLTIVTVFCIWVISFLLALPAAIFTHVSKANITNGRTIEFCSPFPEEYGPTYRKLNVLLRFIIYYAGPLLIIAWFYILMARHLLLSTKNMPGELQGQSNQIRARKKVAKVVLVFVIIFIICFLPHHFFMLWFHFNPDSDEEYNLFWHVLRIVGFCLSYLNSCINPIALYCISKAFRKHFNRYLLCSFVRDSTLDEISLGNMNSSTKHVRQSSIITSHYTITQSEKT
ncbi:neuropeptide CCHamide-1 receptor-like [Rhodnius prolixus]|uniref:G_PROTEIN_RECEP_F1_2 domain-containing protein n=1 Tax=Rhodnius prolixus TaxID=13249 RepID=T1H9A6_RHOPR